MTGNLNGITPTQLGYLTTLTDNVQTQLNNKLNTTAIVNKTVDGNFSSLKVMDTSVLAPSIYTHSWIGTANTAYSITLTNLFGTSIPVRGTFHYHIYPTITSNHAATGILLIENSQVAGALFTGGGPGLTVGIPNYIGGSQFSVTPAVGFPSGNQLNIRVMRLF
jgi:hypothetical protein